jgi:hypothetical protein
VQRPKPAAEPADRKVGHLAELMTSAGLEWLVLLEPQQIFGTSWLAQPLSRILRDDRLTLLQESSGIDLRTAPSIALASYRGDVVAFAVRHRHDQLAIERKFRQRLTRETTRRVEGHQLVHASGLLGRRKLAFCSIGRDVVMFQYGGDRKRGPARIATLYAQGKLAGIPHARDDPTLRRVMSKLHTAPVVVLFPGPFEGKMARGARGLFGAALAIGLTLRPDPDQKLVLDVVLLGNYADDDAGHSAEELLRAAWKDLQRSDLGSLLGLTDATPTTVRDPHSLRLQARLDGSKLIEGLAAATIDDVEQIMK